MSDLPSTTKLITYISAQFTLRRKGRVRPIYYNGTQLTGPRFIKSISVGQSHTRKMVNKMHAYTHARKLARTHIQGALEPSTQRSVILKEIIICDINC